MAWTTKLSAHAEAPLRLGIRANLAQFTLLVLQNAFVGAMVGQERAVVPLLGSDVFGLSSRQAVLAFIVSFGISKATANLLAGSFSERWGRRPILLAGWIAGLPVPWLLMWAPSWGWVIAANLLLGVNQGLAWSMTVAMKIDLAGPHRRGLAMGLNEWSGYLAVGAATFITTALAAAYGLRPVPFYLGVLVSMLGLAIAWGFVRETQHYTSLEDRRDLVQRSLLSALTASLRDRRLASTTQAGFVNNLNDTFVWGGLPLLLTVRAASLEQIAIVASIYPVTWAMLQLGTGALSDHLGRRWPITTGMAVQGIALWSFTWSRSVSLWITAAALLGVGTALVYPTLLATIGDIAAPPWRATAVGVYRFWRDLGYAIGALLTGWLADVVGLGPAFAIVGWLTLASGAIFALMMPVARVQQLRQ